MSGRKIAFLDRDGTINVDYGYIRTPFEFEFLPGAIEALSLLRQLDFDLVVVTNQSGIARGLYTSEQLAEVHELMRREAKKAGVDFAEVLHCPHHPEGVIPELAIRCQCRKPETGMLDQVFRKYSVDRTRSFMAGDKETDMLAGLSSRLTSVMIGEGSLSKDTEKRVKRCQSLLEFAKSLTKNSEKKS